MRMFFVILICKLLKLIGGAIGRGSSLPGQIALKLYPGILSKIKLPSYIIAVTGSNGKTSTVEMIAHILQNNGKTVAHSMGRSTSLFRRGVPDEQTSRYKIRERVPRGGFTLWNPHRNTPWERRKPHKRQGKPASVFLCS